MSDTHWLSQYSQFNPRMQGYAAAALACRDRQNRHLFWDVEALCSSLREEGFLSVLKILAEDSHGHSASLHVALKSVSEVLNGQFGDGRFGGGQFGGACGAT